MYVYSSLHILGGSYTEPKHEKAAAEGQVHAEASTEAQSVEMEGATTGGFIAQGVSGEPAEATQLAAEAITGQHLVQGVFWCLAYSHLQTSWR